MVARKFGHPIVIRLERVRELGLDDDPSVGRLKDDVGAHHRQDRGGDDDRLAVVELESGSSLSDRLNAGVNISRYRFVAVIPPHVRFDREALLRALQPALHDPKAIAGVFSHVEDAGGAGSQSRMARIHRLQSIAAQLSSRLSPDEFAGVVGAHGSVTVWRKDALVQAGGFLNVRDASM